MSSDDHYFAFSHDDEKRSFSPACTCSWRDRRRFRYEGKSNGQSSQEAQIKCREFWKKHHFDKVTKKRR